MPKTYLWIEDRKDKAGYTFWCTLMDQLYPKVVVESKKNNSELVKSVKKLDDTNNKYIIVFDNSFDNFQVYQERKVLKKYIAKKKNILLMDIICFEYLLLEFDKLIEWIYEPDDGLLLKRENAVNARKKLIESIRADDMNYKSIREIMEYDSSLCSHNIEQLSAKLLFDLTRNTGFEVSKGTIGACWIVSCCGWSERIENDACGLDRRRLSLEDKMKNIYAGTSLRQKLLSAGLEVHQ